MRKVVISLIFSLLLNAEVISYKISSLITYAQENPKDIKSRELLLKYFYKKRDKDMIIKYSKELFSLDSKNRVLKNIVKNYLQVEKQEKIEKTLNNLFKNKEYIRFLNFYTALIDTNKKINKEFHLKAIYSAIKIDDYDLAQKIFEKENLPLTPMFSKVMAMLDKKLGNDKSL